MNAHVVGSTFLETHCFLTQSEPIEPFLAQAAKTRHPFLLLSQNTVRDAPPQGT